MKLIGGTYVYNEEMMIPYVMPYVERMGYDKFIVWDDGCTDNTIAKLSQYPFIEIRDGKSLEGQDFNWRKLNAMLETFNECNKASVENGGENVWMTFTDFDEVIFLQRERGTRVKEYLEMMDSRGYNYFDGRMVHLICEKCVGNGWLPHSWNGVRGSWWLTEGRKTTMLKVNDFARIVMYIGNHNMVGELRKGKEAKNLDSCKEFNNFHMKYFDKRTLNLRDNDKNFVDSGYDARMNILSQSFPIENYFLMKGFFAEKSPMNKRDAGEGLTIIGK